MKRNPAVAGQFYPGTYEALNREIIACFHHPLGPKEILPKTKLTEPIAAVVVPHAGYVYSGMVAAYAYQAIAACPAEAFIILGPNHWGRGAPVALYPEGTWATPLGEVNIDTPLAERLLKYPLIKADARAHLNEHSIEVQIPFLQTVVKNFTFVPISLLSQDIETAKALGKALVDAIKNDGRRITIIASSDFSHYVPPQKAKQDDATAISEILALETDKFYELIVTEGFSICGYGPIMTAMTAVSRLGVNQGRLLKYGTSGDIQFMPQVVGYAAIVFEKTST